MSKDEMSQNIQVLIKRIFDLLIATISLVFTLPLSIPIALAVRLDSPGPIFYKHHRIGKNGKPFYLYKFRTMVVGGDDTAYINYLHELIDSDKGGNHTGKPYRKMQDDQRVTRVGGFLRCYYLDELPQFINILKGEMSLVGPRPHVQLEVDSYTPEQRKRLSVKPGATGLWQVAGKADCCFSELIELDLEYIENWNVWLDIKIIFTTISILFRGGENFWTRSQKCAPENEPGFSQTDNISESSQNINIKQRVATINPSIFVKQSPPINPDPPLQQIPPIKE